MSGAGLEPGPRPGVVLAAGPLHPTARLRDVCAAARVVIAADGGLRHARPLGVRPDLLVGDLDSVGAAELAAWEGLPRERHPEAKDALDLELAVAAARARGAESLWLLGTLGGRFDQSLAAVLVAARLRRDEGLPVRLSDGREETVALAAGDELSTGLPDGARFSLLALGDGARVDVSGAAWELTDAPLPFGVGHGVSNASRGGARVRVRAGLVAAVLAWDGVGHG